MERHNIGGVGGSGPAPESGLARVLKWGLAAIIVALVVEGLDQFNHSAAVMLAVVVLLLVLIANSGYLGEMFGDPGAALVRSWDVRGGPH